MALSFTLLHMLYTYSFHFSSNEGFDFVPETAWPLLVAVNRTVLVLYLYQHGIFFPSFPAGIVTCNSLTHFAFYLFNILLPQHILVSTFLMFGFQQFFISVLFRTLILSLKNVSDHILWINPLKVYKVSGYSTGLD